MDEQAARSWIEREFDVPRETMAALHELEAMLRCENERQNLVSRGSLPHIWARHFADSAQLLRWAPSHQASWVDLGSGAGFPGLVVALLHSGPVALIEARALRADYLGRAIARLGLQDRVEVIRSPVERMDPRAFDAISARAFAPLPRLLELGSRFSTAKTRWILPKGRNARSELEAVSRSWQGEFRLEPSLTDPEAGIIIGEGVKRKRN
jgi:16S rRNA (guanine527-N7)-methyltransferase